MGEENKRRADEAMKAAPRASSNMHGVYWNKRGKNWRAHARLDGESIDKEEDMEDVDYEQFLQNRFGKYYA